MKKQLLRDLMYLCTFVFSAGIRNIAVQMFYDTCYPEKKETLVSVALFISALCTMFGIMLSARVLSRAYIAYSGSTGSRIHADAADEAPAGAAHASVQKADRTALVYTFLMYCATNTLMPSVAYIMKDHLHVADYAVKSSLFLAGTVLVSAAVIGLFPFPEKRSCK